MNPNVVFIKPAKSPNLIIIFLQDALDALNGRTFDGRDMRISIDEGRPGGPRGHDRDLRGGGRGGDRDGGRDRRRDRSRSRSGGRRDRSRSGGRRDRSDSPPARKRRSPSSKFYAILFKIIYKLLNRILNLCGFYSAKIKIQIKLLINIQK